MLEAYAYAGDLERVKALSRNASIESIGRALDEAVVMGHLDVAAFLRTQWNIRHPDPSRLREILADGLFCALVSRAKPCVIIRLLRDGSWTDFLWWLFDELSDQELRTRTVWLEYAARFRLGKMGRYLVHRGCGTIVYRHRALTLKKEDLLDLLDLCDGLSAGVSPFEEAAVELFLVKRGINGREESDRDHVSRILREGFDQTSFSDRVELLRHYLMQNPASTSITHPLYHRLNVSCRPFELTPLGYLELLGIPQTEIWTGRCVIGSADFLSADTNTDEWKLTRPNEVEIQAIRDIRAALIEHGADPEFLFAPDTLMALNWSRGKISVELVKRLIHGRADVNHETADGTNPLCAAFRSLQSVEVIKVLLDAGASVDFGEVGNSPEVTAQNILWAAFRTQGGYGHGDILRLILDRKVDPNVRERNGERLTPLSLILSRSYTNKFQLADIMLEYGADINAKDFWGRSPIFRAVALNDFASVCWLIKHGADLTSPDPQGVRLIDFARNSQCSARVVRVIEKSLKGITISTINRINEEEN